MALKALIEKLEDVAEGFRGEYEEIADGDNKGKFRLKVEDAESLVDTKGLKSALERARREGKSELVKALKKEFPSATDDELTELIRQAKKLRDRGDDDDDEGDESKQKVAEKLAKKLRAELEEEYGPIKQENETLKGKLRRVLLDDQIRKLALDAGIFPDEVDDVIELVRTKRIDLNDKDELVVLDKDGDPSAITPDKFFKETYKKEKPRYYKATDASGGDATRGKGGGGGGGGGTGYETKPPTEWTEDQRREFIDKNGPTAYREKLNEHLRAKVTTKAS